MSNPVVPPTAVDAKAVSSAPARRGGFSKYKEVILSIILFIILDLGVLVLNFVTSYAIQRDAVAVNLSGRQRMLSQRTVKSLLQMADDSRAGRSVEPARKELALSHDLFDATLTAFEQSGTVKGGDGQPVFVPAVEVPAGKALLAKAQALWTPYKEVLQPVLAVRERVDEEILNPAIIYGAAHNLELLGLMNSLTTELETAANDRARFLRLVQTVAIVLVLLNFALIVFHFLGKLRRSDAEIETANRDLHDSNLQLTDTTGQLAQAKTETDLILSTVRQGMLLVDADGNIGDQHSAELGEIFQTEHLAGFNFLHLLQRILPEKIFATTRDYFAMLFDPVKKDKILLKINPLARAEANFSRSDGGFTTKHLEFTFRRIRQPGGEGVARVFISVRDITPQVELEERLKQSEQKKERQFELLLGILHVGPDQLKEFLHTVETELNSVNDTLKAEDFAAASATNGSSNHGKGAAALRERLDRVFRSVHNIKGNADFLKLDHFTRAAHAFEDSITELKNRPRLSADDFLGIAIHQADLRNDLAEVRDLSEKLGSFQLSPAPLPQPAAEPAPAAAVDVPLPVAPAIPAVPPDPVFDGVRTLAETLATRMGKEVDVRVTGPNGAAAVIPPEHRALVRDILIQLTRNALAHGVETPAERLANGKPRRAALLIQTEPADHVGGSFGLHFRDDGRGLDPAAIRRRAVARGVLTPVEAAALSDAEAATLVFAPGFSTAAEVTGDAGRGVGLDLLKERVIDDLGGELFVDSEPGRFCEFSFLLPAATTGVTPLNGRRELVGV